MELFGDFNYDAETSLYNFDVTRVVDWKAADEVLRVVGEHLDQKGNHRVESITIKNLKLKRFPRGLGRFFPNLGAVVIKGCGLANISKNDFKGLGNLQILELDYNEIRALPEDVFGETPAIEILSLGHNKIEFELIDHRLLESLHNLNAINLEENADIDDIYILEDGEIQGQDHNDSGIFLGFLN